MGKEKGPVGVVLAYSLTVGYGDSAKVQLTYGESWKAVAVETPAHTVANRYGELGGTVKAMGVAVEQVTEDLRAALRTELEALKTTMKELEGRAVPAEEGPRKALDADIGKAEVAAGELQVKLDKAAKHGETVVPSITVTTESITVFTKATIDAASFGGTAGTFQVLIAGRSGVAEESLSFDTPGERRVTLVVKATLDNQKATRTMSVKVQIKPCTITFPTGKTIPWGTSPWWSDLEIVSDGESSPTILTDIATLPVGPAVLQIEAMGDGRSLTTGTASMPVTIVKAARWIEWTLPTDFKPDVAITSAGLGAGLFSGKPERKQALAGTMVVTEPAGGVFGLAGDKLDLVLESVETATHLAARITAKVKVLKLVPAISWANPKTAVVGDVLGPAQLNATINPPRLLPDLAYMPAATHALNQEGTVVLRVDYPGSASHLAATRSVRLLVMVSQAKADGADAMLDGRAFGTLKDAQSRQRLADWNASNPADADAPGTQGPALMARISTMTDAQVQNFIATEQAKPGVTYAVNGQNTIISYPNGLEVRRKANGGPNYGNQPTVCIEMRKDPSMAVSGSQHDIAFKVTLTGKPAAKGPLDTVDPGGGVVGADFLDGAMATTHLRLQ